MDADDIKYPERLDRQWIYFQQHPKMDVLASGVESNLMNILFYSSLKKSG